MDGRSIRIECGSRVDGRESQLRICVGESHCSIQEICEIVDQRVEESEEMRALEGELATTPIPVIEKEATPPISHRTRDNDRANASGKWRENGRGHMDRSWNRSRSISRPSSRAESSNSREYCRVCRSLGLDSHHDFQNCSLAKAKRQGPFCSYCASRGWEYAHDYVRCKTRLSQK